MRGIYIHVPFCIKKCNYCDFCSFPSMLSRQDEYVRAAVEEIKSFKGKNIKADTVYLGGGTPSLLSCESLSRIMESLGENFSLSCESEITIEVNPCTIDEKKAEHMRRLGINRVSIGAQSFSDYELELLGRAHKSEDTKNAFELCRSCGFDNISLDLMYAIFGQNMESLEKTLGEFIRLCPEHISCYGLKIEEGTPFYEMMKRGELSEKSDEEYEEMYKLIQKALSDAGYLQYELSNFSKPERESRHNLKYWQGMEYIGIGPSASSFYEGKRYTHTGDFDRYIKRIENEQEYDLDINDLMSEYMFLSLRLTRLGASKEDFKKRFSCTIEEVFGPSVNKHIKNGLLLDKGDRYVLAERAYYISNYVLCDFV